MNGNSDIAGSILNNVINNNDNSDSLMLFNTKNKYNKILCYNIKGKRWNQML